MRAVTIIIRFVQLLAIVPIALGLSHAGSFFALLNGFAQGQAWDFAEFAGRLAAFSSPTGMGVAVLVGLELLLRRGQRTHARLLRFPEQPWLWDPMWAEGRVRLSNFAPALICLAAFGGFVFVILPVGLWMKAQKPAAPIGIGLGVLGLFVLALVRMAWLNRYWNRSELELLTLPGVIGGPFRATVLLSESLPAGTALRVTLNCIRTRTVRMRPSGDRQSTTDTIWQDQKILVTAASMSRREGVAIPCAFAIPLSCQPTSLDTLGFSSEQDPDDHVSIRWQLSVAMKDPTDVRSAAFAVPVFRTESSSPSYQPDATSDAPFLEEVDIHALLESLPLQRETSAAGERLRFSMMGPRDFVLLLIVTLAVVAGIAAIFRYVSLPGAAFAAFLPVVLAMACCKTLIEAMAWNTEIEISREAATITAGYLWSRRRWEFSRDKLPTLDCHAEFRRESGSTYCVRLVPADGPPCILVKRLDGQQNADAVRQWLVKQLGQA
jgi:hypothetical protein